MFIIKVLPFLIVLGVFTTQIVRRAIAQMESSTAPKVTPAYVIRKVVLLAIAGALLGAIGTIPAGSLGVVTRGGAVTGRTLEPGFFLVVPVIDRVATMSTQVHAYEAEAAAVSKNLQVATTHVTLNYQLMAGEVDEVYTTLRDEYVSRIIAPALQEAVKATTAEFIVEELVTRREAVRTELTRRLKDRLTPHGIHVDAVSITNFAFAPEFAASVEAKQVAEQQALKAKNDLARVEFEAKQTIEQAKAKAETIRIQAEAIDKQGGQAYVNLKAIEAWNGVLPQWITEGGAMPFVTINPPQGK